MSVTTKRINFFNLPENNSVNDDTKIYRYISLGQFLYIVEKKKLPFVRAIQNWDDPHEGILYEKFIDILCQHSAKYENENRSLNKSEMKTHCNHIKRLVYGSSWTTLSESDAMWRIYSPHNQGVKIQTTVQKLKSSIQKIILPSYWDELSCCVGRVSYNGWEADSASDPLSTYPLVFMYKRSPFKHENEVRAILYRKHSKSITPPQDENAIYANLTNDFIEDIVIDPRSPEWLAEAVIDYCKKNQIKKYGVSDLYSKPRFFVES